MAHSGVATFGVEDSSNLRIGQSGAASMSQYEARGGNSQVLNQGAQGLSSASQIQSRTQPISYTQYGQEGTGSGVYGGSTTG